MPIRRFLYILNLTINLSSFLIIDHPKIKITPIFKLLLLSIIPNDPEANKRFSKKGNATVLEVAFAAVLTLRIIGIL